MAADASIPVFAASTPMSPATERICSATTDGESSSTSDTPFVFCTVTAVIAVMPNTPNALNVLRSAWIPAPPPESEPAIVSARGLIPTTMAPVSPEVIPPLPRPFRDQWSLRPVLEDGVEPFLVLGLDDAADVAERHPEPLPELGPRLLDRVGARKGRQQLVVLATTERL